MIKRIYIMFVCQKQAWRYMKYKLLSFSEKMNELYFFLLFFEIFTMTGKKLKLFFFFGEAIILKLQFLQSRMQWPVVPSKFTPSSALSTVCLSLDVWASGWCCSSRRPRSRLILIPFLVTSCVALGKLSAIVKSHMDICIVLL